jgi:hypothetical protein|uniref:CcmE n=1 Tax=Myoviridae sp. ct8mY9 TaxID=2827664 RepID=A0A8S5SED5_9CAUD|nr:MAG TPA: CcmE [Myoviridae sp. ct8mY9]
MEQEKKFYEKKWFWIIFVIIIIIALIFGQQTNENLNNNIVENNLTDSNKSEEKKYQATQDYDGIYTFILDSDNGAGYTYNATGAIEFENGVCKIKYNRSSQFNTSTTPIEYEGICGYNETDNGAYYFLIRDEHNIDRYEYKVTKNEQNLVCELKSEYDLAGCTNSKLELKYVNDVQNDLNVAFSKIVNEEKKNKEEQERLAKEQEEKDFKSSCQTYTFEQMARNPDNFKGTNVKVTGEVIQALYGYGSVSLRVNITKEGNYTTYYTDTIYVTYTPEEGEDKILEDDIITIYGTSDGEYTYTSTIGASVTLPYIKGKYIEIN